MQLSETRNGKTSSLKSSLLESKSLIINNKGYVISKACRETSRGTGAKAVAGHTVCRVQIPKKRWNGDSKNPRKLKVRGALVEWEADRSCRRASYIRRLASVESKHI
jgi:hypothetical protein